MKLSLGIASLFHLELHVHPFLILTLKLLPVFNKDMKFVLCLSVGLKLEIVTWMLKKDRSWKNIFFFSLHFPQVAVPSQTILSTMSA